MDVKDMIVSTSRATATIDTMIPITLKTAASKLVAKLKWEGTPHHVCIVMNAVSTTLATPSDPNSTHETVLRSRSVWATKAIVNAVIPNDKPNNMGLRQDSGPSREPPVTRSTMP